jgi:uncharacterized protein
VKWRAQLRALHRDLGYVAVSLTLAYGLSGLAVNHLDDWNPNYRFASSAVAIGTVPAGSLAEQQAYIVDKLGLASTSVRGHVQDSPSQFRVFLTGGAEVSIDPRTGRGEHKTLSRRPVLFQVNALHLNQLKGVWTYVADAFAVALMVLALTGVSLNKGDLGLLGRGKWFVAVGLLIPVGFILYLLE